VQLKKKAPDMAFRYAWLTSEGTIVAKASPTHPCMVIDSPSVPWPEVCVLVMSLHPWTGPCLSSILTCAATLAVQKCLNDAMIGKCCRLEAELEMLNAAVVQVLAQREEAVEQYITRINSLDRT